MLFVQRVIPVLALAISGLWSAAAVAYDVNLYRSVQRLEKASLTLSANMTYRTHRYFNKNLVNDARELAHAAASLKRAVRNNASKVKIGQKYSILNYRFYHLMTELGFRNYRYEDFRGRHIGYDVHKVQRNFYDIQNVLTRYGVEDHRYYDYRHNKELQRSNRKYYY